MIKQIITLIFATFSLTAYGQGDEFIEAAYQGLQIQTAAHSESWGLGKADRWDVDMNIGILTFTFADGTIVKTKIQVVGTYNPNDGTFLWGWDHPSVPSELSKHAMLAMKWGKKNKNEKFTNRKVSCSEDEAWRFAAATNRIAEANGVYRGTSGTTWVFMTLGNIEISKPGNE